MRRHLVPAAGDGEPRCPRCPSDGGQPRCPSDGGQPWESLPPSKIIRHMTLLSSLNGPQDLKRLDQRAACSSSAPRFAPPSSTRSPRTGGHLGSSLGVVELDVVLHRLLDSPTDRIVWDTGHQAYAHKLLTGRLDRLRDAAPARRRRRLPASLRESDHDVMDGGHAGTGLSIAEGLALARDERGTRRAHRGGRR